MKLAYEVNDMHNYELLKYKGRKKRTQEGSVEMESAGAYKDQLISLWWEDY